MTLIYGPFLMEFIKQSRTENGCSEPAGSKSQQSKTLNVTSESDRPGSQTEYCRVFEVLPRHGEFAAEE